MDRRTLIGILVIFAIFFLSEQFIWKKPAPKTQLNQTNSAPVKGTAIDSVAGNNAPTKGTNTVTTGAASLSLPVNSLIAKAKLPAINNNIILENDSIKVVFSNQGAVIRQAWLSKFKMADKSQVQLIADTTGLANTTLHTEKGSIDLQTLPFNFEKIQVEGKPGIRFFWSPDSSFAVEKTYLLKDSYAVTLSQKIRSAEALTGYELSFGTGIKATEKIQKTSSMDYKFYAQVDNTMMLKSLAKLDKGFSKFAGKVDWAAMRSKYFVIACRVKNPVLVNSVTADTANGSPAFLLDTQRPKASSDWQESFSIFMGPAQYDLLKQQGAGMENVAERGARWLRWLVDIFAMFLSFLYKLIPNYGVVILIFSIIIKIIMHPLTHKSMDASIKMQKIQPQVAALQAQYKGDPKRMQTELATLYKEAGASPLGGCLPLLLQMPVFFALYTVLRYSLDMRMAHFVGYLKDLSEPDPLYILPILMAVFMIVQSLMMAPKKVPGAVVDEKQAAMQQSQKMMTWIMPVVLFFVFKSMPAGLVLYWTVFNILSIGQQYLLQKKFNKEA